MQNAPPTHHYGAVSGRRVNPAPRRQPSGDVLYDELRGPDRTGQPHHEPTLAVKRETRARLHLRLGRGRGRAGKSGNVKVSLETGSDVFCEISDGCKPIALNNVHAIVSRRYMHNAHNHGTYLQVGIL